MQQAAMLVRPARRPDTLGLRRLPSLQFLNQVLLSVLSLLRHVAMSFTAAVCYHLLLIHTKVKQAKRQLRLSGPTPQQQLQQRPRHIEVPRIQAASASPPAYLFHPFLLPPIRPQHFGKLTSY